MVLYVYGRIRKDTYVLIDKTGVLCCEFDYAGVYLLSSFVDIRGLDSEGGIECAVYRVKLDKPYPSMVSVYNWQHICIDSHEDYRKYIDKGYLVFKSGVMLSSLMPKIMYGISALVSDQGTLLYLDTDKEVAIRLSDFCSRVYRKAIRSNYPVYVLDNKLESLDSGMLAYESMATYRFDTRNLTDKDVLAQFRQVRGSLIEVE